MQIAPSRTASWSSIRVDVNESRLQDIEMRIETLSEGTGAWRQER
jgi:hypothetical protein